MGALSMAKVFVKPVHVERVSGVASSFDMENDNKYPPQHKPVKNNKVPCNIRLEEGTYKNIASNNAVLVQETIIIRRRLLVITASFPNNGQLMAAPAKIIALIVLAVARVHCNFVCRKGTAHNAPNTVITVKLKLTKILFIHIPLLLITRRRAGTKGGCFFENLFFITG